MRPNPFEGPFLPDLGLALLGIPLGNLIGFWIGGLTQPFRSVEMADYVLYGGGILGTFTVWLVLWSRLT